MGTIKDSSQVFEADVLVIGGGLAGLFSAIKAKENGAKVVLVVDKAKSGKSGCSTFAAGVMAVYFPQEDDFDAWFTEQVELGMYLNDQKWLEVVLNETYERIKEMDKWGVEFVKDPRGKFERVLGRGGSLERPTRNIMFHGGPQMMEAMRKKADEMGVSFVDRVMITDLLTEEGRVIGAVGFNVRDGEFKVFQSKATVVSSGGMVMKKLVSPGSYMQTGEGVAMAYRAGAEIIEYNFGNGNAFRAPFAVGPGMNMFVGLGGKFVNGLGQEFLPEYDPIYGNRALLRVITSAMALEVKAGRGPIFMDMTHFSPEQVKTLKKVLPLAMRTFEAAGYLSGDRIVRKIEWIPTGPGTIGYGGGIKVDTTGKASLPALYAAGDASGRMAAGLNEMGTGALTYAAVSGARAGKAAAEWAKGVDLLRADKEKVGELKSYAMAPLERVDGVEPDHVLLSIQEAVEPYEVFIIRHGKRLEKVLKEIERIKDEEMPLLYAYDPHYLALANEARSIALNVEICLRTAIFRQESRGNLREDFPEVDNINWLKWIVVNREERQMKIKVEEIPLDIYRLKPPRERFLHPLWEVANRRGVKWGSER